MTGLETGSFDAVIDKGMTDSIMYNDKFAIMMAKVRGFCHVDETMSVVGDRRIASYLSVRSRFYGVCRMSS